MHMIKETFSKCHNTIVTETMYNMGVILVRLLKKLRQKDSHQLELEKKEQGFALYLNGANLTNRYQPPPTSRSVHRSSQRVDPADMSEPISSSHSDPTVSTRPSKTAGTYNMLWL